MPKLQGECGIDTQFLKFHSNGPEHPREKLRTCAESAGIQVSGKPASVGIIMQRSEQELQRGAVVIGVRAGRTDKEISKFNNLNRNSVKSIRQQYKMFMIAGNLPGASQTLLKIAQNRSESKILLGEGGLAS